MAWSAGMRTRGREVFWSDEVPDGNRITSPISKQRLNFFRESSEPLRVGIARQTVNSPHDIAVRLVWHGSAATRTMSTVNVDRYRQEVRLLGGKFARRPR